MFENSSPVRSLPLLFEKLRFFLLTPVNAYLNNAWQKLEAFLEERRAKDGPIEDLAKFEKKLHDMVSELECEVIAEELQRYDIDVPVIELNGTRYKRVLRCEQTYLSAAGEVLKRSRELTH